MPTAENGELRGQAPLNKRGLLLDSLIANFSRVCYMEYHMPTPIYVLLLCSLVTLELIRAHDLGTQVQTESYKNMARELLWLVPFLPRVYCQLRCLLCNLDEHMYRVLWHPPCLFLVPALSAKGHH
jgi:hypothetical protein